MSTVTETQQPTTHSTLRRLVARHPMVAFLIMAYGLGWPTLLGGHYLGMPFQLASSLLAIFGLALPAFWVTAATDGKEGVHELLRRCFRWQVGIHWYLLALLGLPTGTVLVASLFLGLAPLQALVEKWPLFFTMFLPSLLIAFLLIQLFEETGWTGFMQHTLQERHGPLLASIVVAPFFVLIHLPLVLLETSQITIALFQVAVQAIVVIFFRVIIMLLYNGAGRSVLIVALFHSSFNSVTGSQEAMRFIREFAGPVALPIGLAVLAVVAVLVTVLTKGHLAYETERAALRPAEAGRVAARPRVR